MFQDILQPTIILAIIGLALGAALAVASTVFHVEEDEKLPKLIEALPGANCGACGFTGCEAYAKAMISGEAAYNMCPVGGENSQTAIAAIMGVEPVKYVPKKALVMCGGHNDAAKDKFRYLGIDSCAAADKVGGGHKECPFGCLGLGSCAAVCPTNAIRVINGLAVVEPELCISCGACIRECPRKLIEFWPDHAKVSVRCKSYDPGAKVRKYCSAGCIGCKLCEKVCPTQAIVVNDNLARIDPEKCTNCGACVEKCPTKCIINVSETADRKEDCG